jgi:hypothetical protein
MGKVWCELAANASAQSNFTAASMPKLHDQIMGVLMQIVDIERRIPVQPEKSFGIPELFRLSFGHQCKDFVRNKSTDGPQAFFPDILAPTNPR